MKTHCLAGLWRHPDFMKLWVGQTISEFGSRISREGIPLTALLVLAATPEQMSWLVAFASVPVLLLGLFAGVWVDRLPRRPVMIAADLGRLLLLLTIPFAALTGTLTLSLLLVVTAGMSILSLFFGLAYRAALPGLVERRHMLEANTKLAATDSLAEIGGPAVAGLLIQAMTAPLAILVDSLSFLFSAVSLAAMRQMEDRTLPAERGTMWRDIRAGLDVIARHPVLRTMAVGVLLRQFFGNFFGVLYALYAVRDLGLSPALLGLVVASGGVGALAGTLLAGYVPRRVGLGRALVGSLLLGSVTNLLIPLAGGPPVVAAAMLIIGQIINDGAMALYQVNELTLLQMSVPDHMLGRANATIGFGAEGIAPIGALVGGALAGMVGTRETLWVAVLGGLLTAAWMALSPLRALQSYPGVLEKSEIAG